MRLGMGKSLLVPQRAKGSIAPRKAKSYVLDLL